MKNYNIFIYISNEKILYKDLEFNIDEFKEKLQELNPSKIIIVISDWNIYRLNFNLKLKKISEAKKAAENHFLFLNPDSTYNPKYFHILLNKTEEGFNAEVFYLSKEAEEFVDIFMNSNYKNRIINIIPFFELYKNIEKNYIFNEYVTIIDKENILNFHIKDVESFKNLVSKEDLKEINLKLIENIDIKNNKFNIDFLQKNKGYELLNKFFYPLIAFVIIINIALFSYTKYQYINSEKYYKLLKKENVELKKKVEPVLKAEDTLKKLKDLNKELTSYSSKIFPYLDFLKNLSKVENLFINNMYVRDERIRISGKTKSTLKLIEVLKKLKYLKDPKIVSNIVRDSYGNERFRIEAKITYGK